jgi:NAD+ kinase
MRKFLLVTNVFKDKELVLSRKIISYIEEHGGSAFLFESNDETQKRDYPLPAMPEGIECILVLGGDGTLIRAATKVEAMQVPLIGVNLGTLGYLCELEESTVFSAIDALMADQYTVEERVMLKGQKEGDGKPRLALNDVIIHWEGRLSMLQFMVYVNGEYLATYHADGIVVATPTGSTGYSMSAGGPIVDPTADILLMTPINAHDLNSQSIVLGARDIVEIEMGSRRYQKDERAGVSFDGDTVFQLSAGERVRIEPSSDAVRICRISNQSFLETLRKKMKN